MFEVSGFAIIGEVGEWVNGENTVAPNHTITNFPKNPIT